MTSFRTLQLSPAPLRDLPRDLGPYRVVTPNPRAAAALGVPFVSLDALAKGVLRRNRVLVAAELTRHRTLRAALGEVLAPSDLDGTLRSWTPTVRDLLRAGLDGAPAEVPSGRTRDALAAARRYRERLAAGGQVDPADALWAAAARVSRQQRLLVAGYPRVGPGEYAFLRAAAGPGSRVVLPEEATEAERELNGWQVERGGAEPEGLGERLARRFSGGTGVHAGDDVVAWRFASQEDEVRFALTRVKGWLHAGVPAERIALIARDEAAYGPLLEAIAWEYEVPLVLSYGVPLRDTRFGAWIATLVEAVRAAAPFETTARLLAHPLSGGLDAAAWEAARRTHPTGVDAWRELDPRAEVLHWPARASRERYAEALAGAIRAFGVAERVGARTRDALALRRFETAARLLADPSGEGVTPAEFLAETLELVGLLSVPAGVGREGVALHTPLAAYGARFDHVWALGTVEGVTPEPVRDDPVLDFHERAKRVAAGWALEGAAERAAREAASFAAMLRSVRSSLTLSAPASLGGRSRIPSPYLGRLGLEPVAPPAKPAASPEEVRAARLQRDDAGRDPDADPNDDPVLAAARRAWAVERRRESEAPWDAHDGIVGVGRDPDAWVFSASQLTTLGQCPYKWFAGRLLRLAEPDEADDDVTPLLRGRLWHAALEHAVRGAIGASEPRSAVLAGLDEAFDRAEADEGAPATPSWPQRRAEQLRQLRQAVRAPDFLPDDAEPVAVEAGFATVWRGVRVRGVVDRIDRGPDGVRLIDYKTRASRPDGAKNAGGKASLDVQLPLYREAAGPALMPDETVAGASYYSLTRRETIARAKIDDEALDALVTRARAHLRGGAYPVDPDVDGRACGFCDFDPLCRRGPRLERKRRAGTDAGEPDA